MRHFRYSVNGASFIFIQGDFEAHNLYGQLQEITAEQYNICRSVCDGYAGAFNVLPTIVIPADKVLPDFKESELMGQRIGNARYLWVWRDEIGNVWAEVTFATNGVVMKKEFVN